MVPAGIVSRRSNTQKTLYMLFCLPKCVLASNGCLGFGFLCCFSVLFGSLGGFVWCGFFGFFFLLVVVGFFSSV